MADTNPLYGVLCIALGSLALHDQEDALKIGAMARDALASRPAEVDDWIKLSEQKPEVGESVLVWSDSWGEPMVLRYRVQPWESLLDSEQGRWFWYPDRMLWKRFAAPSHTTNKEKGGADGHVLDR